MWRTCLSKNTCRLFVLWNSQSSRGFIHFHKLVKSLLTCSCVIFVMIKPGFLVTSSPGYFPPCDMKEELKLGSSKCHPPLQPKVLKRWILLTPAHFVRSHNRTHLVGFRGCNSHRVRIVWIAVQVCCQPRSVSSGIGHALTVIAIHSTSTNSHSPTSKTVSCFISWIACDALITTNASTSSSERRLAYLAEPRIVEMVPSTPYFYANFGYRNDC